MKLSISHIVKVTIFVILVNHFVPAQTDSAKALSDFTADTTFTMQKSPLGAVLRSAVIPGWGQIYNHSYIKAPIIWGLGAWLTYLWIWNNKSYKDAINVSSKNFYQDQRDLVAIYMGLTYILNLVDAYVDAELFDFSFKENEVTKNPMLNLRIKIK